MEMSHGREQRMSQPKNSARILLPVLASALAVSIANHAVAEPQASAAGDIGDHRNGKSQEGLMIANVIARGVHQLVGAELERFIPGKTIVVRNTATGQSYSVFYSGDGNCVVQQSAVRSNGPQPVRDSVNINAPGLPSTYAVTKDGRLWTVLDGRGFMVKIYKNGSSYLAIEANDGDLPIPR
jgi:hypothetical protein